jgi:O-antigen/teichoic acid export membrane protein
LDSEVITGALAFALRGATLALRFVLPLALISLLGLEAAGLFAMISATAAIAPAALGFGLNNLLTRDLVLNRDQAPQLITARLAVTAGSIGLAMLAALVIFCSIPPIPALPPAPALAIIALETLALDIHVILIALGCAKRANLLLFLRSAAWIPLFLIAAFRHDAFRSLDWALSFWIIGHVVALATLAPLVSATSWRHIRIDAAWLRTGARSSIFIYAADLGLVGQLYADRYVVGALLGLDAAGIYSVCAAVAQSLQILASSAAIQPALPRLIASARRPGICLALLEPLCYRLASIFLALLAALAVAYILVSEAGVIDISDSAVAALCLLSLAAGARSLSDGLNAVLIGQERHRIYAGLSLVGAALSITLSILMLPMLGLAGSGLAALAAAVTTLLMRVKSIKNRSDP